MFPFNAMLNWIATIQYYLTFPSVQNLVKDDPARQAALDQLVSDLADVQRTLKGFLLWNEDGE